MIAIVRRATILSVLLFSCFSESEDVLAAPEESGETFSAAEATATVSGATMSSTSVASGSGSGSGSSSSSDPSESSDGTSDGGSTSSSESEAGSSESSTTESVEDAYGPCWPGEPAGGSQCATGPHGSLCIADDDPTETGYACTSECEEALDCPAPISGTATPSCVDIGDIGVCILDCELDSDCPEPMVCSVYATGALDPWPAACVWPWGWWE